MSASSGFSQQLNTIYGYGSHTHSISHSHGMELYPHLRKEPEMTAAQKIAKERKEAKEKAKAEALYAAWDDYNLDQYDVGAAWGVAYANGENKITYAGFVKVDTDKWDTTNGVRGVPLEDLLAWLVDKGVGPEDLT